MTPLWWSILLTVVGPPDDEMPTGQAFLDAYFTPELLSGPD